MLKHIKATKKMNDYQPAAFRRLCVETQNGTRKFAQMFPAAFRRLCVETRPRNTFFLSEEIQPPSGGCVLKHARLPRGERPRTSRLQAAVC